MLTRNHIRRLTNPSKDALDKLSNLRLCGCVEAILDVCAESLRKVFDFGAPRKRSRIVVGRSGGEMLLDARVDKEGADRIEVQVAATDDERHAFGAGLSEKCLRNKGGVRLRNFSMKKWRRRD